MTPSSYKGEISCKPGSIHSCLEEFAPETDVWYGPEMGRGAANNGPAGYQSDRAVFFSHEMPT